MALVLFKAVGSSKIGLGHINRCIALVKALPENWQAELWVNNEIKLYKFLAEAPCTVRFGHAEQNFSTTKFDLIIYDEPETDDTFLQHAKSSWSCPIVALDNFDFDCARLDRFINLYNQEKIPQKIREKDVQEGLEFAIIGDQFNPLTKNDNPPTLSLKKVLVMLGGADPKGLTLEALDFLALQKNPLDITVIIGPLVTIKEKITTRVKNYPHRIELQHSPKNLPQIMTNQYLAFSGCATTFFELSHLGIPCLLFAQNLREERFLSYLAKHGVSQQPEQGLQERWNQLQKPHVYKKFQQRQYKVFNGQGAKRVLQAAGIITST